MKTVTAFINHDRMIAPCPNCTSAELAKPRQERYVCTPTAGGCGEIFKLKLPANLDKALAILAERPDPKNRNWMPEVESIPMLRAENKARLS